MRIASFCEESYSKCNQTIDPNKPKSYDGRYDEDEKFPNESGKGSR